MVMINGVSDIRDCKSNDPKFNQRCNIITPVILIVTLFYSFGLLTAYKYYPTGLLVVGFIIIHKNCSLTFYVSLHG